MRVIEADNPESPGAGLSPGIDVRFGIDQKSCRALGQIRGSHGLADVIPGPEQDAAALTRPTFGRVRDHGVGNRRSHRHRAMGYNASTAIAMPMPPPMHNDATP